MRVALTCIAKDEDNYIEEWVNYNLKLGFDDIFIYQNNWRCMFENPRLHKIEFDGSYIKTKNGELSVQVIAHNNFIQTYHDKYDWVAFFDIDEFLVLKKHTNIKKFILDYKDACAIGINWVFFGDNELSFDGQYSLLKRFTKRSLVADDRVKCILKMNKDINYFVHNPENCEITDTHYNKFWGVCNRNKKIDIAQLNHYYCKTWDEWLKKKEKFMSIESMDGWYIHHGYEDKDLHFHEANLNEIEDTLALDFYLGNSKIKNEPNTTSVYRKLKGGDIPLIKNNNPQRIDTIGHFYEKIDGWFDFQNLYASVVKKYGNGSRFVEVGVWKGKSAAYMAIEIINSGKKIQFDCIDNWEYIDGLQYDIDKSLFGNDLYREFLSNIHPVRDVIHPIKSISWEAAELYENNSLDFVFIDAAHDYYSVKKDITSWLPKVKIGGIIAGHDYVSHPSVKKAVDEIIPVKVFGSCWLYEKIK
jgi:hypothetical protein